MLSIIQIVLGILIIILVLLQQRGTEGGSLFGSQTQFFLERRGFEKNIYYFTWILIGSFILVSILKISLK
jgi:protein translocase SecG subunit